MGLPRVRRLKILGKVLLSFAQYGLDLLRGRTPDYRDNWRLWWTRFKIAWRYALAREL